jgi:dimethylargininase
MSKELGLTEPKIQGRVMSQERRIVRAIIRPPTLNFAEGLTTVDLGTPIYTRVVEQHKAYCEALQRCGLELTALEPDPRYPDATFVEDTAVLTERCAILARPGAPSRTGEVESVAKSLTPFYSDLASIHEPGTVDGGDVCEAGNHFFIGLSKRTNLNGAMQLERILSAAGYTSSFIDISDTSSILHLKSGMAYLGENRLAITEALGERDEFKNYELIYVPAGEEYAANCVRINDHVLVAAGYSVFEHKLKELDYHTMAVKMSEFQKMDGGLSCLSLRF